MKRATRGLPGFTLIELMIATVLGSMLLLTAGSLFMTFMIGNANTNARRQMSAEGIQMLGTLEFHIRNAKSAGVGTGTPGTCASGAGTTGPYLTLEKLNGDFISACFNSSPMQLGFNPSGTTCSASTPTLNSNTVVLPTAALPAGFPSPQFTCAQAANGKKTILIQFTLGPSEDTTIRAPFSTTVQLRNS